MNIIGKWAFFLNTNAIYSIDYCGVVLGKVIYIIMIVLYLLMTTNIFTIAIIECDVHGCVALVHDHERLHHDPHAGHNDVLMYFLSMIDAMKDKHVYLLN